MKKGIIVSHDDSLLSVAKKSHYTISFSESEFGPYNFVFDRQRLYFDENTNERGSFYFPLKDSTFNNTEIFIERNDIVIALWERGSFSWETRVFVEIVNITNANKYRFYPDEVSLIYNSKENIVIYYKKWKTHKKLELDIENLEKLSETSQNISAFFKLFYNFTSNSYGRLIYKANSRSHKAWYFVEEILWNERIITKDIKWLDMVHHKEPTWYHTMPVHFERTNFAVTTNTDQKIDVWEASLTWEL